MLTELIQEAAAVRDDLDIIEVQSAVNLFFSKMYAKAGGSRVEMIRHCCDIVDEVSNGIEDDEPPKNA